MKYKLFISQNLGASYGLAYETNDRNDPKLVSKIEDAKNNVLRFYVEGDDTVVCPQHMAIKEFFGIGANQRTSMEEKVAKLRGRFCRP